MGAYLVVQVNSLTRHYHADGGWPPSPLRLFEAVVHDGAMGLALTNVQRTALQYWESLEAPTVAIPPAVEGSPYLRFVPGNAADGRHGVPRRKKALEKRPADEGARTYEAIVASLRTTARDERPWLLADCPLVYVWHLTDAKPDNFLPTLENMLSSFTRLGRGNDRVYATLPLREWTWDEVSSMLHDHPGQVLAPTGADNRSTLGRAPRRGKAFAVPVRGTTESLETRQEEISRRISARPEDGVLEFRNPTTPKRSVLADYGDPAEEFVFEIRSRDEAYRPFSLSEASTLVGRVLELAADRLREASDPSMGDTVDREFLGRNAGPDDARARIVAIPLPSSKMDHADRRIRRVMVRVPMRTSIRQDHVRWAFDGLELEDPAGEKTAFLRFVDDDPMVTFYGGASTTFETVTPCLMTRLAPPRRSIEQALERAGITANILDCVAQVEPYHPKVILATEFERPPWLRRWLAYHVHLLLDRPIEGPLVLGDGRFRGLGVFEPVESGAHAFRLELAGRAADPEELALQMRRAVMDVGESVLGLPRKRLPGWLTGHQPDGAPLRSGGVGHVTYLVDPGEGRLLVRPPDIGWRQSDAARLREILTRIRRLPGGVTMRPAPDGGRLVGRAREWTSLTPWRANFPFRPDLDLNARINADVRRNCRWRGLPKPVRVEILSCKTDAPGGIEAHLRLKFASVVAGPIALGKTAMKGGGAFVPDADSGNVHSA